MGSTKRMLAMLVGSQDETLKKATFSSWHEHLLEVKKEHEISQLQQGLRAKGAESSKRMLGMLMGSQAETMMKATFASWQETVYTARMARIREDALKMRSKEQESQRRLLTMLMGSQDGLLVKTSFTAWNDSHYEAKRLREVE